MSTIKFVSKRIRSKLKNNLEEPVNKHKDTIYAADHDAFVKAWFPLQGKCHDHDTKTKRL